MRLQDVPVDPADTADKVRDVMSRAEFRYEKSWLDRLGEWISRQLQELFGDRAPGGAATGTFGGGAGSLVAWLLIVLAGVAVVAAVVYVVRHRVRRPDDDEAVLTSEIEHRSPARHWADLAARHEAEGEWKEALRCRYRELVRTLVDRDQLPDIAGRTTGELRADLDRSTPAASAAFDRVTLLFELPWYADEPTGPEENREVRALSAQVLEQPVAQRYDRAGQLRSERTRVEVDA